MQPVVIIRPMDQRPAGGAVAVYGIHQQPSEHDNGFAVQLALWPDNLHAARAMQELVRVAQQVDCVKWFWFSHDHCSPDVFIGHSLGGSGCNRSTNSCGLYGLNPSSFGASSIPAPFTANQKSSSLRVL